MICKLDLQYYRHTLRAGLLPPDGVPPGPGPAADAVPIGFIGRKARGLNTRSRHPNG